VIVLVDRHVVAFAQRVDQRGSTSRLAGGDNVSGVSLPGLVALEELAQMVGVLVTLSQGSEVAEKLSTVAGIEA